MPQSISLQQLSVRDLPKLRHSKALNPLVQGVKRWRASAPTATGEAGIHIGLAVSLTQFMSQAHLKQMETICACHFSQKLQVSYLEMPFAYSLPLKEKNPWDLLHKALQPARPRLGAAT